MKTIKAATLRAFHGKQSIKTTYLKRVQAHRKADEIQKGYYWGGGKGCAVGCTIHGSDHSKYETELGIPTVLAHLEDRLFEGLYAYGHATEAKIWPERFLKAVKPGADLSMVWPNFALWLLLDGKNGVVTFAKRAAVIAAVKSVGALYQRWVDGDKPSPTEWESARSAASAASASSAASAAAAYASSASWASWATWAAWAAMAASASSAASADASSAYASSAAYASAARSQHYELMSDKLIDLIKSCK